MKSISFSIFVLLLFVTHFLTGQNMLVANDDTYTTFLNTTLTIQPPGVLANDTGAAIDALQVIEFQVEGTTFNAGETATFSQGRIVINANGGLTFAPAIGYIGAVNPITYTITEGTFTSSATLNITVVHPPTPPDANDDEETTFVNTPISRSAPGVLANDTDVNNDPLTVVQFQVNGTSFNAGETATFSQGSIAIAADGSFTFTPANGFVGNVNAITYTVTDRTFTDSASLTITVIHPPTPPVANDDSATAFVNTPLVVNAPGVLENDTDVNNDPLSVIQFQVNGTTFNAGETATFSQGSIVIAADGSFTFTPANGFVGVVDSIVDSVTDGTFTSSATLNITVVYPPTPPDTTDDTATTFVNTPLTVNAPGVLANDSDINGDALAVTQFQINGTTFNAGETATVVEGTIVLFADGGYQFTPASGFVGNVPIITYTVSDGALTSTATLSISVIYPPTAPVARDDYDTVDENTTLNVPAPGVLANDTDLNEDVLNVVSFTVNGITYNAGQTAVLTQGTVSINADGSYQFVPTPGYLGVVPNISYVITDGGFTSSARLLLTVEPFENLLEIRELGSCNQGFNSNGEYKIVYNAILSNRSNARDYHENSMIRNINLVNDLQNTFGNGCVVRVDNVSIANDNFIIDYVGAPYPREFTNAAINPDFLNATSSSFFNADAVANLTLYPRQSIFISFCVTVNPFCNGRPNPTPSGSGIDLTNVFDITTNKGNVMDDITLTDFHTTQSVVTAGLYIPEFNDSVNPPGLPNSDGTYDYNNRVIITNEGPFTAENVNYNMGLGNFIDNGISFTEINITQVSGPTVGINPNYNGVSDTFLLLPNNSLPTGETIILEIFYLIAPISSTNYSFFYPPGFSQTQGNLDSHDDTTTNNRRNLSFVTWSDALGNHLDRYYHATNGTTPILSNAYCACRTSGMRFLFNAQSSTSKVISNVDEAPNGILEHEEYTFQITIENTSEAVQIANLQLQDNLNAICGGNVISVSTPVIAASTATTNPTLNPSFDGLNDINMFNGSTGLLKIGETITVEFKVVLNEPCDGVNTALFRATNPLGAGVVSSSTVAVTSFTDTDNDGIPNSIDLDDDNDSIPDILEYNGLNPLDDHDNDSIPNYRDTDFGADANGDGIVDIFDFDGDGIPNHFDLDSDNDGILDIVEAGNANLDTNSNGQTNNAVGANGLDNTVETNDSNTANINYTIPNTDNNGFPNFIDIDADDDGIVDIIEAQLTNNYVAPNNSFSSFGIDTAYPNGLQPVDTDGDGIFDYIDINSDNDVRNDIIEGYDLDSDGIPETVPSNTDVDNDGLDDAFDNDTTRVNPSNNQTPLSFPNADNTDTPERDWREIIAIQVQIEPVTETEGTNFDFTIQLVAKNNNSILVESASPITINFTTTNGTSTTNLYDVATSPFDYAGVTNQQFTIPPFTNSATFTISTSDDTIFEQTELFSLAGTITSNNTVNTQIAAVGSILDNDLPPNITMNNSRAFEGDQLQHSISLSNPSSTPISINVSTRNVTAVSPADYASMFETFTINGTIDPNNAQTEVSFGIPTFEDNINEMDEETLQVVGTVTTANVSNQDLNKIGVIVDIDPNPLVVIDDVTDVEGKTFVFTISLLNADNLPMQNYLPIELTLETLSNTARVIDDLERLQLVKSIPAFTSSITQNVITFDDRLNEPKESFYLQASFNPNATVRNTSPALGTGFIDDNDYPNLFSPNGDGKSDVFKISGIVEDYPNFKIIIYDRLGNEVYRYSNNGAVNPLWWDGTQNGNPVPAGVYFYTLDFNNGSKQPIKGFVQLIR